MTLLSRALLTTHYFYCGSTMQAAGTALAHGLGARAAPEVDARPRDRTGKYVPVNTRKTEEG